MGKKEPSIRLSEKHGVNPSLGKCFWCGGDTNEIALLGKLPGDVEAPRSCVLSYEPCAKCIENRATGITLLEAVEQPPDAGMPEIQKGVYPTGSWWVVTPQMIERIFSPPKLVAEILEKKMAFISRDSATMIGLHKKDKP